MAAPWDDRTEADPALTVVGDLHDRAAAVSAPPRDWTAPQVRPVEPPTERVREDAGAHDPATRLVRLNAELEVLARRLSDLQALTTRTRQDPEQDTMLLEVWDRR